MDLLGETARKEPAAIALEEGPRRWSREELDRAVDRTARRLAAAGAGPGDRVAFVLGNRVEALWILHAAGRVGAVPAPLAPGWTAPELAEALGVLVPSVLLCEGGTEEAVTAAGPGCPVLSVDRPRRPGVGALDEVEPVDRALPGPDSGTPAAILWTSGTSGDRRGVVLGRPAVALHARAVARRLDLASDDRWLASLSLAHVGGLMLALRSAGLGSALVLTGAFRAEELWRLAGEGRVTHASLVPTMLRRLLEVGEGRPAPEALRCLLLGGASVPAPLLDEALELGYPVALTYGMTEASSQVATASPDLVRWKPGTVGPALEGVEVRIETVEPGGPGSALGDGGEILVRGPTLALGRVGSSRPLTDEAGWYHTGDLGRLDDEGHLWVTGRLSDRIVSGGVTVDPGEVEAALRRHPGVEDVVVVGVPDREYGERVVAAVVVARVLFPDGEADPAAALDAFARSRLATPKRPRAYRFVDALPRNRNGKVERAAVRGWFAPSSDAPEKAGAE